MTSNHVSITIAPNCVKKLFFVSWGKRWRLERFIFSFETFHQTASILRWNFDDRPEDVICDETLTFDDEIAVKDEIVVAEMQTDESNAKEEEEKQDKQEADVSVIEILCASQIHEVLN